MIQGCPKFSKKFVLIETPNSPTPSLHAEFDRPSPIFTPAIPPAFIAWCPGSTAN